MPIFLFLVASHFLMLEIGTMAFEERPAFSEAEGMKLLGEIPRTQ